MPAFLLVVEGSETVLFNKQPAARLGMHLFCGATIKTASKDVLIGGPTVRMGNILDITSWVEKGFQVVGFVALWGGALTATLTSLAAVGAFVTIGGATWLGLEGVGMLGDMIGEGYGELLQGIVGLGLLGLAPATAPGVAAKIKPKLYWDKKTGLPIYPGNEVYTPLPPPKASLPRKPEPLPETD